MIRPVRTVADEHGRVVYGITRKGMIFLAIILTAAFLGGAVLGPLAFNRANGDRRRIEANSHRIEKAVKENCRDQRQEAAIAAQSLHNAQIVYRLLTQLMLPPPALAFVDATENERAAHLRALEDLARRVCQLR